MSGSPLFSPPRPVRELADLLAGVWQVGYVARDLDAAMAFARDELGLEQCVEVPTDTATLLDAAGQVVPWQTRIAMGAREGLIVEIIQPVSGAVEYYERFLPPPGRPELRLHHLATHIALGDEAWAEVEAMLARRGLGWECTVLIPDRVRAGYVDLTAQLGHFMEICQLQPADVELFESIAGAAA